MSDAAPTPPPRKGFLSALGPAIITASVVLGPGSIVANSKTGADYGYNFAWVLVIAVVLMIGMAALASRIGVLTSRSLGDELQQRMGRGGAVLVGLTIFLIVCCFQFSNNLGVLFAIEPFLSGDYQQEIKVAAVVLMNVLAIAALLFARDIYKSIEKLMKILVGTMVVGFVWNFLQVKPSFSGILAGLVPSLPEGAAETIVPKAGIGADGKPAAIDNLTPVVAMIGTTFSVAAAYYQAYLVKQKGWTKTDYRTSVIDTLTGIGMLGFISLVIMCTGAAAFHNNPDVTLPGSPTAADFARQLEPSFGPSAKYLFCLGIFAGAFSSFLVNALIGGALFSDGCGTGGRMEDKWVRVATVVALLSGMTVAIFTIVQGKPPGNLIVIAQSLTVLGNPLVAATLLWLALQPDLRPQISSKLIAIAGISFVFTLFLAVRTAVSVYLKLTL